MEVPILHASYVCEDAEVREVPVRYSETFEVAGEFVVGLYVVVVGEDFFVDEVFVDEEGCLTRGVS